MYAINQQTSTTGISAELINTGIGSNPYRIVLTGETEQIFFVTVTNVSDNSTVSDLFFLLHYNQLKINLLLMVFRLKGIVIVWMMLSQVSHLVLLKLLAVL